MSVLRFVPQAVLDKFEVHDWRNGLAVLTAVQPNAASDVFEVLAEFKLYKNFVFAVNDDGSSAKHGNKGPVAKWIDSRLGSRGWSAKRFETFIELDGSRRRSPTHEIDCYKSRVALEVEWRNKDPFFDRDLNNFRILFDLGAIDVGIIITRGETLQEFARTLKCGGFGESNTYFGNLKPRIEGGGAGGCPVIAFGIRSSA